MRIVTVLTSLGVGGAEKLALAVAERMSERGHTVALLVLMAQAPAQWPTKLPTLYLDIRKEPGSMLAGFRRARRFLAEFRPEVVHSHSFHANIFSRLMGLGMGEAAVLSTIHNVYEGGWPRMMAYRLTDGLSRRSAAVSRAAAERFVRLGAVPARKCVVVPNGFDLAEFAPSAERRREMRAGMGVSAEFVWLTAGRIAAAKDYPNLLRAFARVHKQRGEAQLWIAGDGEAEPLRRLGAELGIGGAVRWLGLRRDVAALLDAADGFVLGSAWEGMPLVLGEAMAMEKPAVATDVGGVGELAGKTCELVAAKDPEALAKAMIATMKKSEEARMRQGCAARARIEERFSLEASVEAWERLYREILDE
jgi:glycosyltransferase involved in cell wall biosynthesis